MRRILIDLAAILAAIALMTLSLGSAWLVVEDYSARDIAPAGTVIAGTDVGGLSRAEARSLIETAVVQPLSAPISVEFEDETYTYAPGAAIEVDVDSMIERAFDPRDETKLADRAYSRVTETTPGSSIDLRMSVDRTAILTWVEGLASGIETAALDATVTVVEGVAIVREAQTGIEIDRAEAADAITEAIRTHIDTIDLPVASTEPTVTGDTLGKSIVVDLSERKLYLYDGTDLEKTFGVAIGSPGHSTPTGSWRITQKRYMPTWGNPGSAWAVNMPSYIGPGPINPLGTRAINLNASGIRIHGTTQDWSIGRAASHGCMRMHRWDVEDLFDRVEVGMPVFVVR